MSRRITSSPRGIFCLEGDWHNDLKKPSSVRPLFDLLSKLWPYPPFIHRGVGTTEEFEFYLRKWVQVKHREYPILYLAFHGTAEHLYVGDLRHRRAEVSLDAIAKHLEGKCEDRIIHFGACSTLKCNGHRLNRFLKQTGALAVSGYATDVQWVPSAALDLLVLDTMQRSSLTVHGVKAMDRQILRDSGNLAKSMGFRMKARQAKRN